MKGRVVHKVVSFKADGTDGIDGTAFHRLIVGEFALAYKHCAIQIGTSAQPWIIHGRRTGIVPSGYGDAVKASWALKGSHPRRQDWSLHLFGKHENRLVRELPQFDNAVAVAVMAFSFLRGGFRARETAEEVYAIPQSESAGWQYLGVVNGREIDPLRNPQLVSGHRAIQRDLRGGEGV